MKNLNREMKMKKDTIFEDAYIVDLTGVNPLEPVKCTSDEVNLNRWETLKEQYSVEYNDEQLADMIKQLLIIAIVDEQLAELNYLQSYNLTRTEGKTDFDPEFEQHESDEREHKYKLINRLRELDADPESIFTPIDQWIWINSRGTDWTQERLTNSADIIKNRLKEEEEAVEFYTLATDFLRKTNDTTTYTLFKQIKEDEEEHILDLRDLARDHGFIE